MAAMEDLIEGGSERAKRSGFVDSFSFSYS